MKALELRIGNWIHSPIEDPLMPEPIKGDFQVEAWHISSILEFQKASQMWANVQPIPLTEEWLLKFGFVDDETVGVWFGPKFKGTDYRFTIWDKYGKEPYRYTRNIPDDVIDIHFVHQLQNLYFALTGEELTIKE